MKHRDAIGICVIIGLSLFGAVGAAILFFIDVPDNWVSGLSLWVGIIGTLASVALSVLSMVYSNKSSKATVDGLERIVKQYRDLCDNISKAELPSGPNGVDIFVNEEEANCCEDEELLQDSTM